MRTRCGLTASVLTLLAAGLAVGLPASLAAASPSPETSPAPSESPVERPPDRPPFEVWLDRELPADPAPGSPIEVGATLWDRLGTEIPRMGATLFLRALPKDAGEPEQAVAIRDWPGHYRGTVDVPAGGFGGVQLGITGTICENDVCRPDDWVFDLAGTGPPPNAPITTLAEARIDVADAAIRSGEPADVGVTVEPKADWASLELPPTLVVRAREARGPNLATASLPLVDASIGRYEGSITIPRAGDLVLEVATDEDGGDATRFGTSMTRVAVEVGSGGGGGGTPVDGSEVPLPNPSADGDLPLAVIVLLAVVAAVGVGVLVAGFRSGRS